MGDLPPRNSSSPFKPTPPKPNPAQTEQTKIVDDLIARFAQLETRTTQQLSDLQAKCNELRENQAKLETTHANLQEDYSQLRTDHNKLQTESKTWQQKLAVLNLYLETFQADHSELFTKQNNLKEEQGKLRREINNIRAEQQAEINNIRAEQQAEINNIRTEYQAEINNIRTEQQAHRSGLNEVFAPKSDVTEMMSLIEEVTSQLRDLASVKDTNSAGELHIEFHALQSDLSQLQTDTNGLQTEMTQLQEDYQKLATDQIRLTAQVNTLQSDMSQLQTDTKGRESEAAKLQEGHQKLTAAQGKLQTSMNRITTDQKTFLADMTKLQMDHIQAVQAEHLQLQQNQDTLTSEVDSVKTDVEQMKTSLQKSLGKTSSAISALQARLGRARQLFDVGFLNKETTTHNQAMVFETIKINEGGYYQDQTGVFKAPYAGLYFFTATVGSCTKDASVYGHIMVDEVRHCVVQGGFDGGSGCVMVPLTAGQGVRVRAVSRVDHYSSIYSWFRGVLVLPYL